MVRKDIGWAVDQLKSGNKVRRSGWNGKGMWLGYVPEGQYLVRVLQSGGKGLDAVHEDKHLPFILMSTTDSRVVPWLASQTDLLAEDWELVEGQ